MHGPGLGSQAYCSSTAGPTGTHQDEHTDNEANGRHDHRLLQSGQAYSEEANFSWQRGQAPMCGPHGKLTGR